MTTPTGTLVAVIMAGGAGERFWPYSRRMRPKQVLRLGGDRPLLLEAVHRIAPLIPQSRILVVAGEALRATLLDCLGPGFPPDNVVGEPLPRNTAACLALAAVVTEKRFGPATMAVLTADQVIRPAEVFVEQVELACRLAQRNGALVTFGVPPTRPETGFGYIEAGDRREDLGPGVRDVTQFREKPDLETARRFVASERFFWNTGMFAWTGEALARAFEQHAPRYFRGMKAMAAAYGGPEYGRVLHEVFEGVESEPIDRVILEKATNRLMIEARYEWDDIGCWTALERLHGKDSAGNVASAGTVMVDSRDSILFQVPESTRPLLVATLGVKDLIIVVSDDVVMVCDRNRPQDVKTLVQTLREQGRTDVT